MNAVFWTPKLYAFFFFGTLGLVVLAGAVFITLMLGQFLHLWEWDADDELHDLSDRYRAGQVLSVLRSSDTKELRRG